MPRSTLLRFGLVLLLLFAQTVSAAHGFSHLNETTKTSSSPDPHQPHSTACEQCLAAAALDAGMPTASLAIEIVASNPFVVSHPAVAFRLQPAPVYSSRAPPRFV